MARRGPSQPSSTGHLTCNEGGYRFKSGRGLQILLGVAVVCVIIGEILRARVADGRDFEKDRMRERQIHSPAVEFDRRGGLKGDEDEGR